jgi:NADH:ubiquinone oxidoreductase subunit K
VALMLFYVAIALVVVAQGIGIYGLITRKADLVFTLTVIGLLILAAVVAYFGTSGTLH